MDEPKQIGRYRIDGILGDGAMGVVYAATHEATLRPVALKLLRAELVGNTQIASRCLREARIIGSIDDPGVVRIVDAGVWTPGRPYVVMERLRGEDLGRWLHRSASLGVEDVVALARAAARSLRAVHRAGLVHRDVKPGNLFHSDRGWKLLDFGIARSVLGVSETMRGMVVGTPHYLAPEQVRGQSVGPACDVWALGVVLFRCLAGRFPFDGPSVAAILNAITEGKRARLARLGRLDVPQLLIHAVESCLEPDPLRRPHSMDALLGLLARLPPARPGFSEPPAATLPGPLDGVPSARIGPAADATLLMTSPLPSVRVRRDRLTPRSADARWCNGPRGSPPTIGSRATA